MAQPVRWRNFFWPALLIILGLLLLLANVGLLPPIAWRSFSFLWPVLLIAIGVELIATGRISWAGVLGGLIALFILALVAGALGVRGSFFDRGRPAPTAGAERRFEQTLDGVRSAEVQIDHGADRLDVTSGAREGLLLEAIASGADGDRLQRSYEVRDGVGRLRLSTQERDFGGFFRGGAEARQLVVRLSPSVPLSALELNGGASQMTVDLSDLQVQRFQLNVGASNGRLRLPTRGAVSAELNAGASNLTVEIPNGVAARIKSQGGLSAFTVNEQRFPSMGGEGIPSLAGQREYRSADFETNPNHVDLQISAGAAQIEVR